MENWTDFMNKITKEITSSFGKYLEKRRDILTERKKEDKGKSISSNRLMEINTVILKELKSHEPQLLNFINYIAESSILVLDNEFNHKLIQFKDIDFNEHRLRNKYTNIIIHYRDDDIVDTFLDVLSSIKEGALTVLKFLKGKVSDSQEGCGISGTKCLTPRLAIKCFQLLNDELLKHNYKPDGSITNVSLGDNKGIMTQRYERMIPLDTLKTFPKKKQSAKKKQSFKKAKADADAKAKANVKADANADAKAKANVKADANANAKANVKADADAKAKAKANVKADANANAKANAVVRNNSGIGKLKLNIGGFRKIRNGSKSKNVYSAKT